MRDVDQKNKGLRKNGNFYFSYLAQIRLALSDFAAEPEAAAAQMAGFALC